MSGHCEGVCTPALLVYALVRGSTKESRRRWHGRKPLIFMHFHGVFLGSQHTIWPKQHNGKVRKEEAQKKSLKFVQVKELIDKGIIQDFSGHGSPDGKYKDKGLIPYV